MPACRASAGCVGRGAHVPVVLDRPGGGDQPVEGPRQFLGARPRQPGEADDLARRDRQGVEREGGAAQAREAPGRPVRARCRRAVAGEEVQAAPEYHFAQGARRDVGDGLIVGHEVAVAQHGDRVADLQDLLVVMGDEHERDALTLQLAHEVEQHAAVRHGEGGSWARRG